MSVPTTPDKTTPGGGFARAIRRPNDRFTMLANEFIRDQEIRPGAFRVAVFVLSHDSTWQMSQGSIAKALRMDAGTVRKAFGELEELGYMRRIPQYHATGRAADLLVLSHERLSEHEWADELNLLAGESPTGKTPHGESPSGETPERKKTIPSEEQSKDLAAGAASEPTTPTPVAYSEAFEAAWAAYGRKGAKRKAWLEWQRAIRRAPIETITAAIPAYLANKPERKFRKDFERFLSGDVWESADCAPSGTAAATASVMTLEAADAWLADCFRRADVESVVRRTGRPYHAPTAPPLRPGQTADDYLANDRREWIRQNRVGLRRVLMGKPFSNGTEVQA